MKKEFKFNVAQAVLDEINRKRVEAEVKAAKPTWKETLKDTACLYGKCFLVGCTMVTLATMIKDAVKENENFKKKYGC